MEEKSSLSREETAYEAKPGPAEHLQLAQGKETRRRRRFWRRLFGAFDFSLSGVDKPLFVLLVVLVLFGLVMVTSTASYTIIRRDQQSILSFMTKQAVIAGIGFIAMFFMAAFDYRRLNWHVLLWTAPIIMILNLLPRVFGAQVNGAYRWLDIGFTNFQPSELAKFFMAIFAANLMAFPPKTPVRNIRNRYLLLWGVLIAFIFIIAVVQSNLSTSAIMGLSVFFVILTSHVPLIWNIVPAAGGFLAGALLIFKTGYRTNRMIGFKNPFADPTGNTLQVVQSLYALSMGGLLGRGLGNSRFKAFWLPFAENDFIFAIICEELGLAGGLAVIAAFCFLVLTGIRIGRQSGDAYGRLLAVGIVSVLGIQAAINMAVVMGAFPVTGVPLPFISAGGTSMIVNLAAMGILLNISKKKR